MKNVLISGASGFLGKSLCGMLPSFGWQVRRLSRDRRQCDGKIVFHWDPYKEVFDTSSLSHCDAVIHLSGESVFSLYWTEAKKKRIQESRLSSTRFLARCVSQTLPSLPVFISASAIGYYGSRQDEWLPETAKPGKGFLSEVTVDWENCILNDTALSGRKVLLRTGVVMDKKGGMLRQLEVFHKAGVYLRLGNGKAYISWIALIDWLHAVLFILNHSTLSGPVNMTAPEPLTNLEWVSEWRHQCGGFIIPLPERVLRLFHGEIADEIFLTSQRAMPKQLMAENFEFKYPRFADYLKDLREGK